RVPDEEIAALAAAHATGPLHKFLRAVLVAPCRVLFGPRRGPRAARRLLYEISWRFAGERTYSARGLPGRLFYAESCQDERGVSARDRRHGDARRRAHASGRARLAAAPGL